jgi:ubiquinone/menaquinone biosynthesis C-methylase UbiE
MADVDYWEEVLKNPPESYRRWFNGEKRILKETVTKDAEVLDVCCGTGRTISDIISITQDVTGIDCSAYAVEFARKKFKNYPSVNILIADAHNLPFGNNTFDFVICSASFNNFGEGKLRILNEMKRVLKKGGILILSVYNEDAFDERVRAYTKIKIPIKNIIGTTVYFDKNTGYYISEQFSKEQLAAIFKAAGMKIVDIKKISIAYVCKLSK